MVMSMSRPSKHPKTGVYQLRRRVPADLVDLIGKNEVKRSLGTKDRNEAAIRHAKALADIDEEWRLLRSGPREFTEDEAAALAADIAERWVAKFRDYPPKQVYWNTALADQIPIVDPDIDRNGYPNPADWLETHAQGEWVAPTPYDLTSVRPTARVDQPARQMLLLIMKTASEAIRRNNWMINDGSRLRIVRSVVAGLQNGSFELNQHFRPGAPDRSCTMASTPPVSELTAAVPEDAPALELGDALELWKRERQPKPKTIYEYIRILSKFAEFLGHSDAKRIAQRDVIAWKDSLIDAGLAWKTIQGSHLAAVSTVLEAAVGAKRLSVNPARGASGRHKSQRSNRRGYTDEEAALILRATHQETNPVLRFIPVLCAYSGARLSEVCQLRKEDIFEDSGVWCMNFTSKAGSLKTDAAERTVPLHAAIVESDFLSFVTASGVGPLFKSIKEDTFGSRRTNASKIVGRYIRGLGITDHDLAPSHSWRHRFKSLGREYGLRQDVEAAIVGHAPQSVGDGYGSFSIKAMKAEIDKIPALNY